MEKILVLKPIKAFSIAEEILKRKDWVKYKTIPDWHGKIIGEKIILSEPGKQFNDIVNKYVNAYLFDQKAPPTEIATPIVNIADDYLNGREIVVRSGDYIAIQNFARTREKE
jgi:hypothetical protein